MSDIALALIKLIEQLEGPQNGMPKKMTEKRIKPIKPVKPVRNLESLMRSFLRARNVSCRNASAGRPLYDLVASELIKYGVPKPEGVSNKVFTLDHFTHNKMPMKSKKEFASTNKKNRGNPANHTDFLTSYEWRKLRMLALKKYGPKCQCCGASPTSGAIIHVDHIKPRRYHPELALDINNLQVLCQDCNHGKGAWDDTDWRPK